VESRAEGVLSDTLLGSMVLLKKERSTALLPVLLLLLLLLLLGAPDSKFCKRLRST
jgi:hypothetical protein